MAAYLEGGGAASAAVVVTKSRNWDKTTNFGHGEASCKVRVKLPKSVLKKDPNATIRFTVDAFGASEVTATIKGNTMGDGVEPHCDILPNGPSSVQLNLANLAKKSGRVKGKFKLHFHAHDDADCFFPGRAFGEITVTVTAAAGALVDKNLRLATKRCG